MTRQELTNHIADIIALQSVVGDEVRTISIYEVINSNEVAENIVSFLFDSGTISKKSDLTSDLHLDQELDQQWNQIKDQLLDQHNRE
jgi:hypothetical protein